MLQIKVLPQDGSDFSGEVHRVAVSGFRIGRDPGNDLVLNDPSISRLHSVLVSNDNGIWVLKDQASRNGLIHQGEKKAELEVSGPQPVQVYLGEILLELSLAPSADITRSIDLTAIRAKSLGGRTERQPVWSFLLSWLIGGFLFLFAGAGLQTLTRAESETIGRVVAVACGVLSMIVAVAIVFSGLSKLNRREYRFQKIFRITFLAMALSFFFDSLASLLIGQATSSGTQQALDFFYNALVLGTGFVFVLKEIFPSLRLLVASAIVAGILLAGIEIRPVSNMVARTYRSSPAPVPTLMYPLPGTSWSRDLESVFYEMDKVKPESDEERSEILKLR